MDAGWLYAGVAALTWGVAGLLAGQAARRGAMVTVLLLTQTTGLVTMVFVTLVQSVTDAGVDWTGWLQVLPWAAVAGLAELLGFAAFYRALSRGPMGIAAPVAGLGVVVPVLVGMTSGAMLGHWQVCGLILVAVGIVLLGSDRAGVSVRVLVTAAASGLGFGIALVALAQGAQVDEVAGGTLMRLTTVAVLLPVWLLRPPSWGRPPAVQHGVVDVGRGHRITVLPWVGLAAVAGVFDALGNLAFALSSTHTSLTVAALISSLDPVVTAVLARWWLGERLRRAGRWGAAAAVIGAALVSAN